MADAAHNLSLEEMDRQSVLHPFTQLKQFASGELGGPRIVEGGEGIRIRDTKGNELIDGFAGLYCVNVGYGRGEIAEAIYAQAKQLAYYHAYAGHSNEPTIRLSDKILRKTPPGMSKIFYGLGGSDANETNAKIVWYYNNVRGKPNKTKFIARRRGYHGGTVFSGSLTGLEVFHTAFNLPVPQVLHTTAPHHYWQAEEGMSERDFSKKCAEDLNSLIEAEGPETVGAFIGEPVLGTGGIIPPPEGYWEAIQEVLDRHDVLLISDEVVCGFGRLGSEFGAIHYGMKPDLMTVAKGLTSAYQPLSGSIVGDRVWKVLEDGSDKYGPFAHGLTYSAHPCGAAAALANLEIIERENLVGNAKSTGAYFQKALKDAFGDHPIVGEVRGEGLLAAVEFVADPARKTRFDASLKVGAQMAAACVAEGLISRAMPHGDILGFAPPLIVREGDIDEIVARTKRAVDSVTDKLVREGSLKAA
ncbi:aminotransferase class III-fold pyridoxal phosphate-dependent enzyme [Marivibrio halodurans]|uniref:Aminotransferase class III-fold pyridoxal phosphate-dependent enzyme n=1 Tax=Marivibrio halodurans TaxID=2039722 RepID=A0A8J7V450_9PROT|nr:aminotransferase [Marivibrio halodurans]MBP5858717.1 aminotransferase class III-fold pyridoxal phosphate-dependent enzyme [Marivibrio halodurans]